MTNESTQQPIAAAAIEQLYQSNYQDISTRIYQRYPDMLFSAHNSVMGTLAAQLPDYDGEHAEAAFLAWTDRKLESDPVILIYRALTECESYIHRALWDTLGHRTEPNKFDDYPELVKELTQELYVWVWEHADELVIPGPAKLSTRLYERAHVMTRGWKSKAIRRRNAVIRHEFGLPSKEAAERKAAELDEAESIRAEMRRADEAEDGPSRYRRASKK